ncbi:MAG TPA: hypothetical protein DEV68_05860 [Corynebacterium flavescens]|nr:hypothetical protein [Corynebacterium flavescens]
MWAYEATTATQTFAADDRAPRLIVGMAMDKPGHRIAENAVQSLDHLMTDPSVPKCHFMGAPTCWVPRPRSWCPCVARATR